MKKNYIKMMILVLAALSLMTSLIGIISDSPGALDKAVSVFQEEVNLHNRGIYQRDSISVAAQGIASDWVTALAAIPALLLAFRAWLKGSLKGHLALIGIMGYFLYTYTSYTFLWVFNPLFLIYVAEMSLSVFVVIGLMMNLDVDKVYKQVDKRQSVAWAGVLQLLVAFAIGMMWLGKIIPATLQATPPVGLEHYTTLVIQAMDLGLVVPLAVVSAIALLRKKPWGYVLTPVILTKGSAMLLAISAMMMNMIAAGVQVSAMELVVFPVFALLFLGAMVKFFKIYQ